MAPRQAVLALQKERPRQLQAHTHQIGTIDQHGAEGGNSLVQKRIPLCLGNTRPPRCSGRRQAEEEECVALNHIALKQRPQDGQGLVELALLDQRPGLRHACIGRHARTVLRVRCRNRKYKKDQRCKRAAKLFGCRHHP